MDPLKNIPASLLNNYTLNGKIPIYSWYINENVEPQSIIWSDDYLKSFIERFSFEKIKSNNHGSEQYLNASLIHVECCEKYIDYIRGKDIAVIGSQFPWIEAILVNAGAKSITTVEYNVPVCNHTVIRTISYDDFCKSDVTFDSIFSYSSIEHSGLGRYGDPLNPNGDIETMEHIYRVLKPNGYCFLGVPVGKDALVWNAHRIYGTLRLPLVYLNKFEEVEWLGFDKSLLYSSNSDQDFTKQPIIVLKK